MEYGEIFHECTCKYYNLSHQYRHVSTFCRMALTQQHVDVAVVLNILSVQVVRHLYERLFVSAASNARMHVLHYVLGMFFYPAVAFTALLHLNSPQKKGHYTLGEGTSFTLGNRAHEKKNWYVHILNLVLYSLVISFPLVS